ncbi:hypothetical protein [Natronococcus occultus]|uniref:Uncharacterized protein n=1 Tax=Natronococcus occultus SP4 TaxID=694430 RepID=L0JVK2_9EURY|nr:hypothetical protein [Natronococcus occultus]AGB36315.1 hypothetical protein Natoc_0452 [Natronococcus occultus SP4]
MSLDRHAADRRRFARLLGTDGSDGLGLPIGLDRRDPDGDEPDPQGEDRDAASARER